MMLQITAARRIITQEALLQLAAYTHMLHIL